MRLRSPITFIGISLRINTMQFSTHRFYQNYTIKTIYTIVFCDMALPMWICSTKAFFILSKMRSTVLFSGGYGSAKAKRETLPRTISHHFDNLLLEIYLFRALLSVIYVTVAMLNIYFNAVYCNWIQKQDFWLYTAHAKQVLAPGASNLLGII